MKICSVEGCDIKSRERGFCKKHYKRWKRHGDPLGGHTFQGSGLTWLQRAIEHPTDECMEYPYGRFPSGYGTVQIDGRAHGAHRVVCEMAHGPPPSPSHHAAHWWCGNPPCCNPQHIRWATASENNADKVAHGTAQYGERANSVKLKQRQIPIIRRMLARGMKQRDIARLMGVSQTAIYRINVGKTWNYGDRQEMQRALSGSAVRAFGVREARA